MSALIPHSLVCFICHSHHPLIPHNSFVSALTVSIPSYLTCVSSYSNHPLIPHTFTCQLSQSPTSHLTLSSSPHYKHQLNTFPLYKSPPYSSILFLCSLMLLHSSLNTKTFSTSFYVLISIRHFSSNFH